MRGCCHVLADLVFVPEANPCIKSILKHNFLAFIQDYCTAEIYPSSCLRSAQVIKTHTRKQSDASSGPASYIAPSIFCSGVIFLSIQTTTHIRFNRGLCLWMPFFSTWSEERRCLACPLLGVEGKMKDFIDRILSCLGAWASGILQNCMSNIIADFIVSPFSLFFRRTSPVIPL